MEHATSHASKFRLFLTQFLLPQPIDLIAYFFAATLILLVASRQTLLVILSDGSPVTDAGFSGVYSQRLSYLTEMLQTPILGRAILFLFWLAIGSIVYMMVWLFQNLATEVADDVAMARNDGKPVEVEEESDDEEDENDNGAITYSGKGWWGTALSHTIFVCSSIILLLFFILIAVNFILPGAVQLFEIGLTTYRHQGGVVKLGSAILLTMFTIYVFVLFWRLFFRLRSYIYNSF